MRMYKKYLNEKIKNMKILLLLGSNSYENKDGVGQYVLNLYDSLLLLTKTVHSEVIDKTSILYWIRKLNNGFKNYDLVHMQYPVEAWKHSVLPGILPVLFKIYYRKQYLVTLHEWNSYHFLRKLSIIPLCYFGDGFIFVSTQVESEFINSFVYKLTYKKPTVKLIPLSSNIEPSSLKKIDISEIRNKIVDDESILIGYFGFIYDTKLPLKMLEIVKESKRNKEKIKLLICGSFQDDAIKEKETFFSYINENDLNDYVIYKGFIKDEKKLSTYLSSCNAMLLLFKDGLTSRRSSFWYSFVLGNRIITTAPGNKDEFNSFIDLEKLCVNNELLFVNPEDDAGDIYRKIIKRFRKYKFPNQRENIFSWDNIARKHLDFYNEMSSQ